MRKVLPLVGGGLLPTLLHAQMFYAYPQTFFSSSGIYSLRLSQTAYIFEDDMDRLFYPVHIYGIKKGRFFLLLRNLSTPSPSEVIPDNDITFGAKTNLPLNLSFLYSGKGVGDEDVSSSDTTYAYSGFGKGGGGGGDNPYFMEVYSKDSTYSAFKSASHSFLLSGGWEKFGFFFLVSHLNSKEYVPGDTSNLFGNFYYTLRTTDTAGNVLREETFNGYALRDSLYRPILGGISFRIGDRFSALAFGGVITTKVADSSGYTVERDTADANAFVGDKVVERRLYSEKGTPWLFGLQGDYSFLRATTDFRVTFLYVLKNLSSGEGIRSTTSFQGWWDTLQEPTYSVSDTSYERFTYSSISHEVAFLLRGKHPVGDRIKLGFGIGLSFLYENREYDTITSLASHTIFRDANGNGVVDDPADFRNVDLSRMTYRLLRKTTILSYYVPLGFELQPFEALSGLRIRGGTILSGRRVSIVESATDFVASNERIEETPGDTLTIPRDLTRPDGYSRTSKTTTSPYPLYYGVSWKVGENLVLDISGVGYGITFPYIWSLSLTFLY